VAVDELLRRSTARGSRNAPLVVDDDDDDGLTTCKAMPPPPPPQAPQQPARPPTKYQLKKTQDHRRYIESVTPVISIDRPPRLYTERRGRAPKLSEYTFGCELHMPFVGETECDLGPDTARFVDTLNSVCWGYKDGVTAISISAAASDEAGRVALDRWLLDARQLVVSRDRPRGAASAVIVGLADFHGARGTVSSSESGNLVQFSLTYDRLTRCTRPSGAPIQFRDGPWFERSADVRVIVAFDVDTTDFVARFMAETYTTMDAAHAFPKQGVPAPRDRQCYVGSSTYATFFAAVEQTGVPHRTLAIVVTDPLIYNAVSLSKSMTLRINGGHQSDAATTTTTGSHAAPPSAHEEPPDWDDDSTDIAAALARLFERDGPIRPQHYTRAVYRITPTDAVRLLAHESKSERALRRACDFVRLAAYAAEEVPRTTSGCPTTTANACAPQHNTARELHQALVAADAELPTAGTALDLIADLRSGLGVSAVIGTLACGLAAE
jgi:hypothetical protein